MKIYFYILFSLICFSFSCSPTNSTEISALATNSINTFDNNATVTAVIVTGNNNNYSFNVSIKSPDKGCNQYADWWEVISEDGQLISRRILLHSHVNEQPFSRSQNGIQVSENQTVIIRAHMNNKGYGNHGYKGSVAVGFSEVILSDNFALELKSQEPLPTNCAF